jgi:hypothetical protein
MLIEIGFFVFIIALILEGIYRNYYNKIDEIYNTILTKHNIALGFSSNLYEVLHLLSLYQLHIIHQMFFLVFLLREELYIGYMSLSKSYWFSKNKNDIFKEHALHLDKLMTEIYISKLSIIYYHLNHDDLLKKLYGQLSGLFINFIIRKQGTITLFKKCL